MFSMLEQELRQGVNDIDESGLANNSPPSFCSSTFSAIQKFFIKFEALDEDRNDDLDDPFPHDFIRRTVGNVHRVLGDDHEQLRKHVLTTLQAVQTRKCRELVLEFLPLTLPRDDGQISSVHFLKLANNSAKKEVFSLLKQVLHDNSNLMKHTLTTLAKMEASHQICKKDLFRFALVLLPTAPENDLHIVIETLIQSAENASDAHAAVDAVRMELFLLGKTEISDMFRIVTTFENLMRRGSNQVFMECYVNGCEKVLLGTNVNDCGMHQREEDEPASRNFSVFDLAVLLLANRNDDHGKRVHKMFHFLVSECPGVLMNVCPQKFAELMQDPDVCRWSNLRHGLLESFFDIVMASFLSFHFSSKTPKRNICVEMRNHMAKMLVAAPEIFRKQLVRKMLLTLRVSLKRMNEIKERRSCLRETTFDWSQMCRGILCTLTAVVNMEHGTFVPCANQLIEILAADDIFIICQDPLVLSELCKVTISIIIGNKKKEQLLMLCRTLLFSHHSASTPSLALNGTTSRNRQLRGLAIVKEICKRGCFESKYTVMVGKLVLKLRDKRGSTVDPEVDVEVVRIMRHLHFKKDCSFDGKEIITSFLTSAQIVHCTHDKKRVHKANIAYVTYNYIPASFMGEYENYRRFPTMRFTFASFYDGQSTHVSCTGWKQLCTWLFTLLDAFLSIGRPLKWKPQAWTEAVMEFPCLPSTFTRNNEKCRCLSKWLEEDFGHLRFSLVDLLCPENVERLWEDAYQTLSKSYQKEVLQFSLRFSVSLLLGLAASAAIIKNVHDFFFKATSNEVSHRKNEAVKLIQYQLMKMYDLEQHCRSMRFFFLRISRRKQGRRSNNNGRMLAFDEAHEAATQSASILHDFLVSTKYVPVESIWVALTDPSHDSFIVSALNCQEDRSSIMKDLAERVIMRQKLLSHLARTFEVTRNRVPGESRTISEGKLPFSRQRMAQFLRMGLFLSQCRSPLFATDSGGYLKRIVDGLSVEYLRFLRTILISAITWCEPSTPTNANVMFSVALYTSLLGSPDPMNDAIQQIFDKEKLSLEIFKSLGTRCLAHLQKSTVGVAVELLDTLSVLVIPVVKARPGELDALIDLSWNSMRLGFNDSCFAKINEMPYALHVLLKQFLDKETGKPSGQVPFLEGTIFKLIHECPGVEPGIHIHLVHQMCRHWSLVALSPQRSKLFIDHLTRFYLELVGYLEDNDKPCEISVPVTSSTSSQFPHRGGRDWVASSHQDNRIQREIPPSEKFPCLRVDTCFTYFDVLLKLGVASLGTLSILDEASACRSNSWSTHPFHIMEIFFEFYGSLLQMLKDERLICPESVPRNMIQTLKLLLDVSVWKIEQCIDWRNREPHPSVEVNAGTYDPSTRTLLKALLDSFRVEVIRSMELLCVERKTEKMVSSLNRKVGKVSEDVRRIGADFGLGELKTEYPEESHTYLERRAKRLKVDDVAILFDASTIEESVTSMGYDEASAGDTSKSSRSNSASSDGFGVSGDWGQGNNHSLEDGADDDDDDSSRRLGEITITH